MAVPLLGAAAKAIVHVVKHPDKTGGFAVKLIMGMVAVFTVIPILGLSMIGSFQNQGNINGEFAAAETPMYKAVKKGYDEYTKELNQKMLEREKEIIEENTVLKTYIYIDEEGKEHTRTKEVSEARVIKQLVPLDIVYYIAFINHSPTEQVKEGKQYKVQEKKVITFCESISTYKEKIKPVDEEDVKKEYHLYNEVLSLEQVANLYFSEDVQLKQMFLLSYDLYLEFITTNPNQGTEDPPVYPNTGMAIPHYFQTDYKNVSYGDGTIASSGCAPTAIAMVLSYLTEQTISPITVVNWTGDRYYVPGSGSSWSIFSACASNWGVSCSNLGKNQQAVIDAIKNGRPVIASMGPGTFTKGGHIIVLRGVTEDGCFLVNDPNRGNLNKYGTDKFSCDIVFAEAKNFWSFTK